MSKIAVLGGGIAGLAAAYTLSRSAGCEVQLFEAAQRLGGVLETIHDGNYLIERSADNFATLIPDAYELSRACGLEGELIRPSAEGRQAFVLNRGRILPIPAGFSLMQPTRIGSIITTQTLSWRGKLRLLGELWAARKPDDEDESLESFAVRRLGREAFENLVEPIVSGIFTADPSTLSMAATMPQFVQMEQRCGGLIRGHLQARKQDAAAAARKASGARYDQFVAPREGMNAWIAGIAAQLPAGCVQLNTPVVRVSQLPNSSGWSLETPAGQHEFDAIVCALPAAKAAGLLEPVVPAAVRLIRSIPYASSAVAAMVVNRRDIRGRIDGFGLIVPQKERRSSLAISYTSNKYPGRVPEDEILLRVFLGGAMRPEVVELNDNQLLDMAAVELRDILGWQGKQANWQAIVRWKESMPQYLVGHVSRMKELATALNPLPTLKLCGAAYDGVGIPQCVRGAQRVANQLVEHFTGSPPGASTTGASPTATAPTAKSPTVAVDS